MVHFTATHNAVIFSCILLLSYINTSAQVEGQSPIDSLEALLVSESSSEVQMSAMITLSKLIRKDDPEKAMGYGKTALNNVDTTILNSQLATLYVNLGKLHLNLFDLDEADKFYSRAIQVANELDLDEIKPRAYQNLGEINYYRRKFETAQLMADSAVYYAQKSGNKEQLTLATGLKGSLFVSQNDHPNAIVYLLKLQELAKEIKNLSFEGVALANLGIVYEAIGKPDLAIKTRKEGLGIAKELNNSMKIAQAMNELANSYISVGEDEKGMGLYYQAMQYAGDEKNNSKFFGGIMINLGRMHSFNNVHDSTLIYTKKGLDLLKNHKESTYYHIGLNLRGYALVKSQRFSEGIKCLSEALVISRQIEDKSGESEIHKQLAFAYEETGETEKAYEHFKEFIDIRDTIISQQKLVEITETRLNSGFVKKQLSDSLTNAQTLLTKDLALVQKKKEQRYILLGLLLLCGMLALLYRTYRNLVKASRIIGVEKERAEKSELKLKELDITKNRLYTNITHEFRTPLTVITGMASQIRENPNRWLDEGLTMMERNGHRLLGLVNQMLDLSKLESGKINLNNKQSDVIGYLKYLTESLHSFFESQQIELVFESKSESFFMDFDETRIQQVIVNLLSNAAKFSAAGDKVNFSVSPISSSTDASKNSLKIIIKDTGAGIKKEDLPFIFDRFYQVDDSATRGKEGSGIGLALVKELIKLMQGEIVVTSQRGVGTTFTILLPVSQVAPRVDEVAPSLGLKKSMIAATEHLPIEQQLIPNSTHDHANPVQQRLLIIEDNPDVVTYLRACLEDRYEIYVGQDGELGIAKAYELVPDIIITDVMMPKKDGFEVCQVLKMDTRTSHIPIVMLTAKADVESKLTGLAKGADAYLSKPFDKKELRIRLKKLLELRNKLQVYYGAVAGLTEQKEETTAPPMAVASEHDFVKKMRKIIEEHMANNDFGVEQFSQKANLSASQLNRKLTALISMTASKFIRHVRINEAKKLLTDQSINIAEIAYSIGFSDAGHFSRIFKKDVGKSPSAWRESKG